MERLAAKGVPYDKMRPQKGRGEERGWLENQQNYCVKSFTYMMCIYIIYIYIYIYIHTYIHMYIHTYIHTYVRTYIRPYAPTYIYIHTHASIRTYMHTSIHACMHTHTHTHTETESILGLGEVLVQGFQNFFPRSLHRNLEINPQEPQALNLNNILNPKKGQTKP